MDKPLSGSDSWNDNDSIQPNTAHFFDRWNIYNTGRKSSMKKTLFLCLFVYVCINCKMKIANVILS